VRESFLLQTVVAGHVTFICEGMANNQFTPVRSGATKNNICPFAAIQGKRRFDMSPQPRRNFPPKFILIKIEIF